MGALEFFDPDLGKFPCLTLARQALGAGGTAPIVLNAANEVAVAAFLDHRIVFTEIPELIERALADLPAGPLESIEVCVAIDAEARRRVQAWVAASPGGPRL
jgi:1-deoxy-D-xylulose-5-phosphate reductoisomerase